MRYPVEQIRSYCEEVWIKAGLSPEDAKVCVDVLLAADLRGQRTHGVTHMRDYCDRMVKGTSTPGADAEFALTSPTSYVVDAKYGVGMVVAPKAMKQCMEQAKISEIGRASCRERVFYSV